MPRSAIDICNMALGHLGRTTASIQSFTEKSIEARLCALWYDPCRQEVLEAQDWGFARRRVPLAMHADVPPDQWGFRYQAPADMLALRSIWNPFAGPLPFTVPVAGWPGYLGDLSDAIPYEMESSLDGEQSTILTNQPLAIGIYTMDIALASRFSPLFVNALSHCIANKSAYQITGKQSIEDKEGKAFLVAMRSAAGSDANQHVEAPQRDGYAVRARL